MLALVVVEGLAVLLLGVLVAGLLRSHADILRSLHELGAGSDPANPGAASSGAAGLFDPSRIVPLGANETAHDVAGERLDGTSTAIGVVGARHTTLLAFLSSGCLTCRGFWDELRAGAQPPDGIRLLVVVQSEDNRPAIRDLAGDALDVIASSEAWSDYAVPGSPHFVQVDGPTGRIVGEGTAHTWSQVMDLLGHPADQNSRHAISQADSADSRDNPTRIDRELAASGIGPGHPSLRPPHRSQ